MIHTFQLQNTGGDAISSLSISSGVVVYTNPVNTERAEEVALILVNVGTLTIAQEVSVDKTNFYTPYDIGGRVSLGTIGSGLSVSSLYISLNKSLSAPIFAPWTRFLFLAHATATLTAYYLHKE